MAASTRITLIPTGPPPPIPVTVCARSVTTAASDRRTVVSRLRRFQYRTLVRAAMLSCKLTLMLLFWVMSKMADR